MKIWPRQWDRDGGSQDAYGAWEEPYTSMSIAVFAYGWDHWVNKTGTIGSIDGMGFLSVTLCNVRRVLPEVE